MDARLREGIVLFNAGRFFESHEAWEVFYRETEDANKPFIEGLILLAAAFRLFRDFHDVKGPVRMIFQALIRFEPYPPLFLNIRVKKLCAALEAWANEAQSLGESAASSPIPKIRLARISLFS